MSSGQTTLVKALKIILAHEDFATYLDLPLKISNKPAIQMIRDEEMQTAMKKTGMQVKSREKISFGFYHTMLMNASHK